MVTDPVCLKQIEEREAKITAEFRGNTYYFDSERCRDVFRSDPAQYAAVIPRLPTETMAAGSISKRKRAAI